MTDVLGVLAYLLLPLVGVATWRLPAVRRLSLDGRLAVAWAAGVLVTGVVMATMSLLGIRWSRTTLFIALGVAVFLGLRRLATAFESGGKPPQSKAALSGIVVFLLLAAYGLLTARQTCGDLEFFWGPKGIKFFRAGAIDGAYLSDWNYRIAHSDYPPLLPLLYAWSNTLSHQFSWWAAVLSALFALAVCVALVRSFSGDDHGALFTAAILAYAFAISYVAGGADPLLLVFETLAIVALTWVDDPRSQSFLAAIGLAGAAWTKVEGAAFVVAVVMAVIIVRRQFLRAIIISVPALILVGGWIGFVLKYDMLDSYRGGKELYFSALPKVLQLLAKTGTYDAFWIPWIACIALIVAGRNFRRAAFPLLVAALTMGATIYFYLHDPEPTWWILTSGRRVLLTPLLALTIAAVAAAPQPAAPQPEVQPT